MKDKISVSVERNIVEKIERELKKGMFRNRSHIVEYAISKFLEK
ncbi:ribbon-helix-helix protein, CopG family [Candidatus Woesearchaeota archaeon]|nr:ribbon-helix-helix protein, CopG family [Candidatus Woesearchaeota archaeon]